jgi:hypothetical protein
MFAVSEAQLGEMLISGNCGDSRTQLQGNEAVMMVAVPLMILCNLSAHYSFVITEMQKGIFV